MSIRRCTRCETPVPHNAQFCPKCGQDAPPGQPLPTSPHAIPSKPQMPAAGKGFFIMLLIAVATLIAGFVLGLPLLCYIGGGLAAILGVLVIVGDHLF